MKQKQFHARLNVKQGTSRKGKESKGRTWTNLIQLDAG